MRRRDLLAGLGSAGVIAGGGAIAVFGLQSEDTKQYDPFEIETVDAPGSEAGTVSIPVPGQPTFVDFFATWCGPCEKQMEALGTVHERYSDEVRFVSVTNEPIGRSISEAELVSWWEDHDGNWTLGLDPTVELAERHLGTNYPSAVVFDDSRQVKWAESGEKSADELADGIEQALNSGLL